MSFYVSTAIYFLLHCDEWDRFVTPPPETTEGGAFLNMVFLTTMLTTADVNIHALNRQIGYRHPNKEHTIVRPEMTKFKMSTESKHGFLFCGNYILKYW
jgi:hypothetical protein